MLGNISELKKVQKIRKSTITMHQVVRVWSWRCLHPASRSAVANVLGFHQTTAKDTLMRFVFCIGVFVLASCYFCILHWYFCIWKLLICICTHIWFTLVVYWSVIANVLGFHQTTAKDILMRFLFILHFDFGLCQACRRFLTISDPRWDQPISDIFI